jgi:hypothetical protein
LAEVARIASWNNEQIRNYLGSRLNVKNNWKLRAVRDMLLNHTAIKQVNDKPIVLLYSEEKSPSLCSSPQSDVSEVRYDVNTKTLSSGYEKASLSIHSHPVKNPDDNSKHRMDGTSHTSHTSLSHIQESRNKEPLSDVLRHDCITNANNLTSQERTN